MIADWGRLTEERLPYRASELDQSLLGRLSHLGVFLSKTDYWNTPKHCVLQGDESYGIRELDQRTRVRNKGAN